MVTVAAPVLAIMMTGLAFAPIVDDDGAVNSIYVDDSAVNGANDGSSWNDAFTDLQDALAIAKAGDEIRVGQGTYRPAPPNGDRTISFILVDGTTLQGGYAGVGATDPDAFDPDQFITTLNGDLNDDDAPYPDLAGRSDNSFHVLIGGTLKAATTLRGVMVTAGHADDLNTDLDGSGLRLENGNYFTVDQCVFDFNAFYAGAVCVNSGAPRFTRCRFVRNRSLSYGNYAGGALVAGGPARIEDCWFERNSGGAGGGAIRTHPIGSIVQRCFFLNNFAEGGGAIGNADLVIDCFFIRNSGPTDGGGAAESVNTVVNCVFLDNYGEQGGALEHVARVINSVFIGNRTHWRASAIHCESELHVVNCTFVANQVDTGSAGAVLVTGKGHAIVQNSIFHGNVSSDIINESSQIHLQQNATAAISHSCIQGWTGSLGGMGNHGSDPRFVDADGPDDIYGTADDDVRLRPNSLCIDSADRALLPPDTYDIDEDGDTTEPLPIDLDGLSRVVGSSLDAGAYEFQGIPCRADIDGNDAVNVFELLTVITNWGVCAPAAMCNADLDLNRNVGVSDLQAVIHAWGACP